MIESIPLPVTDNPVDAPYWAGAARGELLVQYCGDCAAPRFPPRPMCPVCQSMAVEWRPVSGNGEIWSFVVAHPPLLPAFAELSPYTVALVALKELPAIRIVGAVVGTADGRLGDVDPRRLAIGAPVTACFQQVADDVHLLRWMPVDRQ